VKVDTFISPNDPLRIFPNKEETYEVIAKSEMSEPFVMKLIILTATERYGVTFKIGFTTKNANFYGKNSFTVNELNDKKVTVKKIKEEIYEDIWIFQATDREYEKRENFIERLYWSKAKGLVGYEKKDGEYWEIIQ
jgi:hypothetical protein